jgi:hypothetical protein
MYTIEQWAKGILDVRSCRLDKNYGNMIKTNDKSILELIETDTEYTLIIMGIHLYSVDKTECKSVLERLTVDGFDLFYYCDLRSKEYRFSYLKKDVSIVFDFFSMEGKNHNFIFDFPVVINEKNELSIGRYLLENVEHLEMISGMKERFTQWIQDSKETRIDYLLNPENWIVLTRLEDEMKELKLKI